MTEHQQPPDHDPYDGYADYAEDTRKEVAADDLAPLVVENRDVPVAAWSFFSFLQKILSFGIGISFYAITLRIVASSIHGDWGFAGLIFVFLAMFVGVVAAFIFSMITRSLLQGSPSISTLLIIDAVALIVIVITLSHSTGDRGHKPNRIAGKTPSTASTQYNRAPTQAPSKKPSEIKTGSPPGVTPPMLTVDDQGKVVTITNTSKKAIFLGVARVRQNNSLAEGWQGCRMLPARGASHPLRWEQFERGVRTAFQILPGDTLAFTLQEECAAPYFYNAPLEYRVGAPQDADRWWSDSALHANVQPYQLDAQPPEE